MSTKLKEMLERAEAWPEEAQEELIQAGLEIEEEFMQTSAEKREAVDRARAWARLDRLFARIRKLNPKPKTAEEIREEEEKIAKDIKAMRRPRQA